MRGKLNEEETMKIFRGMRGSIFLFSMIYVLIGIILLIVSDAPMLAVSYIFSVLLIVSGIILVMYYIGREAQPDQESYDLAAGILATVAGIYLLIYAKLLTPWIPAVMGILVIVSGVITFQNALDMRRLKQVFWAPVFLISLASMALGAVILYYPFQKTSSQLRVIGASMFLSGGIDVITTLWQTMRIHGARAVTQEMKSAVVKVKDDVVETAVQVKKEVATITENKYNKALEKTKGNGDKMEVIYSSTRNAAETATASQAILKGLAENGGLFVPNTIPALDVSLEALSKMSYQEVAYEVMSRMLTDFTLCRLCALIFILIYLILTVAVYHGNQHNDQNDRYNDQWFWILHLYPLLYGFRLRILNSEGLNSYSLHSLVLYRTIHIICTDRCYLIYNIHSLCDLTKRSICAIQMW